MDSVSSRVSQPKMFLSLSGDLGIGLVWDYHPHHRTTFRSECWNPLQTELNYLWRRVLSCSQDDIRWFLCFSMFSDVFQCWENSNAVINFCIQIWQIIIFSYKLLTLHADYRPENLYLPILLASQEFTALAKIQPSSFTSTKTQPSHQTDCSSLRYLWLVLSGHLGCLFVQSGLSSTTPFTSVLQVQMWRSSLGPKILSALA